MGRFQCNSVGSFKPIEDLFSCIADLETQKLQNIKIPKDFKNPKTDEEALFRFRNIIILAPHTKNNDIRFSFSIYSQWEIDNQVASNIIASNLENKEKLIEKLMTRPHHVFYFPLIEYK